MVVKIAGFKGKKGPQPVYEAFLVEHPSIVPVYDEEKIPPSHLKNNKIAFFKCK